jgi:CcmD family protein
MSAWEHTDLEYLFYAYSAAWAMLFAFLVRMDRRSRRLARDLAVLQHTFSAPEHSTLPPSRDQTWPGPSV